MNLLSSTCSREPQDLSLLYFLDYDPLAHMAFVYCFSLLADFFLLKCAGAKNR